MTNLLSKIYDSYKWQIFYQKFMVYTNEKFVTKNSWWTQMTNLLPKFMMEKNDKFVTKNLWFTQMTNLLPKIYDLHKWQICYQKFMIYTNDKFVVEKERVNFVITIEEIIWV